MLEKVIILGAGGHAKVIADIVIKRGDILVGFLDDFTTNKEVIGYPVLGKISDLYDFKNKTEFIIGIGNNSIRRDIAEKYEVKWYTAIHPISAIAIDVNISEGAVIMANAVINTSAKLGKHCIINTGAIVEHDDVIADYVHLSPQSVLGGNVTIGERTHIGIGAVVRNGINITSDCVIGAGTVVVKDITEKGTYIGIPATRMNV